MLFADRGGEDVIGGLGASEALGPGVRRVVGMVVTCRRWARPRPERLVCMGSETGIAKWGEASEAVAVATQSGASSDLLLAPAVRR